MESELLAVAFQRFRLTTMAYLIDFIGRSHGTIPQFVELFQRRKLAFNKRKPTCFGFGYGGFHC
jgi:hypothetical protein